MIWKIMDHNGNHGMLPAQKKWTYGYSGKLQYLGILVYPFGGKSILWYKLWYGYIYIYRIHQIFIINIDIYGYIYIYIYIWVNCNISLTWIVRPFGDDSSYWPWFQWGRTVRSLSNLPIYIYILVNYKTSQTWRGRPFGDSCPYEPFIPVTSRCEVVIKFSQISISGFNL